MRREYVLLSILILLASCVHSSGTRNNHSHEENQLTSENTITIIGEPNTDSDDRHSSKSTTESICSIVQPSPLSHHYEQIIKRKAFIVSYNKETRCPNWVAWHLTAEHTDGNVPRYNDYLEDEDVPKPRATNDDYRGSGWSRGHMCPAGDNKWDEEAMRETFLLTNMCPQNRELNSGLWNRIEQDCRQWARAFGELFIVCGPVLLNRQHETIGTNRVVVPEAFFKVILCLQGTPKAIGFIVRNNEGKKKRDQFINSVDEVERITGYDFFPSLPDSIENVVEDHADIEDW